MRHWDEAAAFALTLPESELSTAYRHPAIKVNGKTVMHTGGIAGSFVVRSPHAEKAMLLGLDPDTFWQTPHYQGWPNLLVRYGSPYPERVRRVIARAWWDCAKPRTRRAHGERP